MRTQAEQYDRTDTAPLRSSPSLPGASNAVSFLCPSFAERQPTEPVADTSIDQSAARGNSMSAAYGRRFHRTRDSDTAGAAAAILAPLLRLLDARSVCDIGCGVGTWLRVARAHEIDDIAGFEGEWLDPGLLVIDPSLVTLGSLERRLSPSRRYDLAICLEVAEHLSPPRAAGFVSDLCRAADAILFSAAVPGQGGVGHQNEQWPSYWARLFADAGYDAFDIVRPAIWSDSSIPFWYRQNTIVYARRGSDAHRRLEQVASPAPPLDLVHPDLYARKTHPGPRTLWRQAVNCLRRGRTRHRAIRQP